jgi:hypothetical protein
LLAADNTITITGQLLANGGLGLSGGANGSGGMVRMVAATIAGNGLIQTLGNPCCGSVGSANGIIRLESFTISYNGGLSGNAAASSSPGQIFLPSAAPAFIQFASITDNTTAANTCTVGGVNACNNAATSQATPGRTGGIASVDVTMPNPNGPPVSPATPGGACTGACGVTIVLNIGPNTGAIPFPSGKLATLEVAPQDPSQGLKVAYTTPIVCTGNPCTATFPNVVLPLGFSSMSAFTVLNVAYLNGVEQLSRRFPTQMEGEQIEAVRIQAGQKETEYVLIAKSGREFPYKPSK